MGVEDQLGKLLCPACGRERPVCLRCRMGKHAECANIEKRSTMRCMCDCQIDIPKKPMVEKDDGNTGN